MKDFFFIQKVKIRAENEEEAWKLFGEDKESNETVYDWYLEE